MMIVVKYQSFVILQRIYVIFRKIMKDHVTHIT